MPFPENVSEEALVRSHRWCCVCQEFGGRSVNVHHIVQEADGGPSTLDNAIVLCLRCHAEAGHYNPNHPLGKKYSPDELRQHRDQWWDYLSKNPAEPLGFGLEVKYKKDRSSKGDLHTYWLLVSFTNTSNTQQNGYALTLLFPPQVPLTLANHDHVTRVRENGAWYNRVEVHSNETIYRDQTIEIISQDRRAIRYEMNHDLFWRPDINEWRLLCHFHVGNLRLIREQRDWSDMHAF